MRLPFILLLVMVLPAGGSEASAEKPTLASVDIFVAVDCPIANAYAPEINRIFESYRTKGVLIRLVYPDPDLTEREIAGHVEDYGLLPPTVIDRDHSLVKRAGATITPEATVFDADGGIVYRGRIDNLFADYGARRREATERYLRDALEAVIRGEAPAISRTEALGCVIEPLP